METKTTVAGSSEESFAELFEKSYKAQKKLTPGEMVEAVIVELGSEWVFIDVGGKGEGYVDRKELTDAEGNLTAKVGDKLRAYFVNADQNELRFTVRVGGGGSGKGTQQPDQPSPIEEAYRAGIPVEGTIAKEIKGGYEVTLGGAVRAFCPYSQLGARRDEPAESHLGKNLTFMVAEYRDKGRSIVVSRRPILEQEKQQKLEALRGTLQVGDKVRGTVTSLQKFGAFVDIGGLEGLLPISELGWQRTEDVSSVLKVGQQVDVIVLKLDWDAQRFSFSLKEALPDPWDEAQSKFPAGSFHAAKITRLMPFGAFAMLADGVEGLLHISKLGGGKRINHPRDAVSEGQQVEVLVEAVDLEARRISLNLAEHGRSAAEDAETLRSYAANQKSTGASFGTFGDLLKAKVDAPAAGKGKRK